MGDASLENGYRLMNIRTIDIKDFRCFKTFKCQFKPGVNVLIGRNGAGKTTLIHAIHKAMSFIFSNDRSLGKEFLSQGNNTLNVRGFKESDYRFDVESREPVQDASIKAKAMFNGKELSWELYRRNQPNAALYQSKYKKAFVEFMHEWKKKGATLPLLAYYSDSYPHKYVKTVKYALDIVNNGVMPRNFGYYQWDDEAACTSIWETRISNCLNKVQPYYTIISRLVAEKLLLEEKYQESELEENADYQKLKAEEIRIHKIVSEPMNEMMFVENRLKAFAEALPGIKEKNREIEVLTPVQTQEGFQLALHFKDGSTSLLQDLPAGYRRLYSIVFDMAYRSYILNGEREPEGLVVIDEIDLHLHPELEKEVLNVFHQTFKGVQFVVSTHSPIVLTNLQSEGDECQILRMESGADEPEKVEDIYGLDYNTGVEDVMGVDARNVEIDNMLNSLAFFEEKNMTQQARTIRTLLLNKLKGDEQYLTKLLDKRRKEMGDEIHQ